MRRDVSVFDTRRRWRRPRARTSDRRSGDRQRRHGERRQFRSPANAGFPVPECRKEFARPSAFVLRAARSIGSFGNDANISRLATRRGRPRHRLTRCARRVRHRSVGVASRSRVSANAARGAEQHETSDARGVAQREVQRDARPEGVAAQRRLARVAEPGEQVCVSSRDAEYRRSRRARAGRESGARWSCQNGTELMCRVLGLREAVEPHEEWARAATLDTEE